MEAPQLLEVVGVEFFGREGHRRQPPLVFPTIRSTVEHAVVPYSPLSLIQNFTDVTPFFPSRALSWLVIDLQPSPIFPGCTMATRKTTTSLALATTTSTIPTLEIPTALATILSLEIPSQALVEGPPVASLEPPPVWTRGTSAHEMCTCKARGRS